jgi:hypothetical protein
MQHMFYLKYGFLFSLIFCTSKATLKKQEFVKVQSTCDSIRAQYFDTSKVVIDGLPIAELVIPYPDADTINTVIQDHLQDVNLIIGSKISKVVNVVVDPDNVVICVFGMEEYSYGEEIKSIIKENFKFKANLVRGVRRLSRYSVPIKIIDSNQK